MTVEDHSSRMLSNSSDRREVGNLKYCMYPTCVIQFSRSLCPFWPEKWRGGERERERDGLSGFPPKRSKRPNVKNNGPSCQTQEIDFDGIHSACRHPIRAHPTVRELPKLPTRTRFLLVNMPNIFSDAGNEQCLGDIPARMELA